MKTMKNIFYIGALVCAGISLTGCEKDLKDYDGVEGVYFYVQREKEGYDPATWACQYYTPVEFLKISGDEYDVKLRVMTTGRVKDYDRTFRIVVDRDSTTAEQGVNYEPFEELQVVSAGECYTDVMIRVKRDEGIQKVERQLGLRLLPTEDFQIGIPTWYWLNGMSWPDGGRMTHDATAHKILTNDFIVKPNRWPSSSLDTEGTTESGRWGVFTEKKYRLICERMSLTYEDFTTNATMPGARQIMIQETMAQYLQEMYNNKTPILEEDGRLMWFQGVTWKSVIGTPWIPEE